MEKVTNLEFEYKPSPEQVDQLLLLATVTKKLEDNDIQYVVLGGYGLDSLMGYLTREHKDFDLVVSDLMKTEEVVIDTGFVKVNTKESGVMVYKHDGIGVELEVADLSLARNLVSSKDLLLEPVEGRIGEHSFYTAPLELQKAIRKIQKDRLAPPLPKTYEHDENIIAHLDERRG